jgi:hypothetical protein
LNNIRIVYDFIVRIGLEYRDFETGRGIILLILMNSGLKGGGR